MTGSDNIFIKLAATEATKIPRPSSVCVILDPLKQNLKMGAQRHCHYQHKLLKLSSSVTMDQAID